MTMPGVSCKAVATQNSSEWPCSMCPFPWLRLVGVRTSYIYFSNISWTPWALDPITNPFLGPSTWLHPASILLQTNQNEYNKDYQWHQVQVRMWSRWRLHVSPVGRWVVLAPGNILCVSVSCNINIPQNLAIILLGIYPRSVTFNLFHLMAHIK